MFFSHLLLQIIVQFSVVACFVDSVLNGVELRIIPIDFAGYVNAKRNATGYVIEVKGVLMPLIHWLEEKFNFSYIILGGLTPFIGNEDSILGRGAVSYIRAGEADLVLAPNVASSLHNKHVDYTASWSTTPLSFLIPYPTSSENIAAVVKPFDFQTWIYLILSFPLLMSTLHGLSRAIVKIKLQEGNPKAEPASRGIKKPNNKPRNRKKGANRRPNAPYLRDNKQHKSEPIEDEQNDTFGTIRGSVDYVSNVFFSHGGWCSSKKLAIRLAAGTWCLACFIIVTAYSSVLISFIVSPNLKPIINSIEDIPKVHRLKIAAEGSYKMVADQWRADPSLLFNTSKKCVEEVRKGNRNLSNLAAIMNSDHKSTGKCSFTIARKMFRYTPLVLMLQKESPYTDLISQGLLELSQSGLIKHWEKQILPQPDECLTNYQDKPKHPRISMKNLSGAFLILLVGFVTALFVFTSEKIVYYHTKNFGSNK